MISWSIEAAQASGCFDKIIVSTDDLEIAEIAKQCGADVPFIRPYELSDDHTGTTAVMAHAIRWLASQGKEPSKVCCLYAHDAGQFYWGQAGAWQEGRAIFCSASVPVLLPRHRVQDIDTNEDWDRAEWLFRAMRSDN